MSAARALADAAEPSAGLGGRSLELFPDREQQQRDDGRDERDDDRGDRYDDESLDGRHVRASFVVPFAKRNLRGRGRSAGQTSRYWANRLPFASPEIVSI